MGKGPPPSKPLAEAAARGDTAAIMALLAAGEVVGVGFNCAIYKAAQGGHTAALRALLDHAPADHGNRGAALIAALDANHDDAALLLIERGAHKETNASARLWYYVSMCPSGAPLARLLALGAYPESLSTANDLAYNAAKRALFYREPGLIKELLRERLPDTEHFMHLILKHAHMLWIDIVKMRRLAEAGSQTTLEEYVKSLPELVTMVLACPDNLADGASPA